jgi:phosphatidate phosphatase PAH1
LINDHQQKRLSSNILGKALCCSSCLGVSDDNIDTPSVIEGTAFDVIVVEGQDGKLFQNSDFLVSFKGKDENNNNNNNNKNNTQKIVMELDQDGNNPGDINGTTTKAWFPIQSKHSSRTDPDSSDDFDEKRFWGCCHPIFGSAKPNMLTNLSDGGGDDENNNDDPSFALKAFLKPGRNKMRYLLLDDQRIIGVAHAYIFLWNYQDSVVVSDIDGTITKSNARGVLGTIVTKQYVRVCHVGICHLLSSLSSSSQIVYVTSRPLSLANQTRQFLSNLRQGNETLPHGPLLGFEGKMSQLVVMELLSKTTQKFKSGKLWKQVVQPFRRATNDPKTPFFVTGIGNTIMDVQGKDYF